MEKKESIPEMMHAWAVVKPGPIDGEQSPLQLVLKPVPKPKRSEVLVKVLACGVCHTDLHVSEGDLPVHQPNVTPGHEIVGQVVAFGEDTQRFKLGERIGIPWFRHACGYAEYVTVPEGFAYRIPARFDDLTAAPLLCAGIIGYRAYLRANVPAGGRLGLYGFGGSAHITAQIAIKQGIEVHVFTRGKDAQQFARQLGCASAQGAYDQTPVLLDSAIMFAPAGQMIPKALENLAPGGTLALAGIHMSDVPQMAYQDHLFHEKVLTSVESNTRRDGEEFLTLADRLDIHPSVAEYPLAKADEALRRVKQGDIDGACVLRVGTRE